MKLRILSAIFALVSASAASAQTTGYALYNDLTWTSFCAGTQGAGGTSCTSSTITCGLSLGGLLEFSTNAPNSPAYLLIASTCAVNSPCLPPATSYDIPYTAVCSPLSNQSLDLLGYGVLFAGVTDPDGKLTIPVPPMSFAWLDIQAVVIDPFSGSLFPLVFSQALHLT